MRKNKLRSKKIKPYIYSAIVEGRLPVLAVHWESYPDKAFNEGEEIWLVEWEGIQYYEKCPRYDTCRYLHDDEIETSEDARDWCGKSRSYCEEYEEEKYTGRRCRIKIKEVFTIQMNLYTFEILEVEERTNEENI